MKTAKYIKEWNKVLVPSSKRGLGQNIGIILPPPVNYKGEINKDGITFQQGGTQRIRVFDCEKASISHYRLDAIRKYYKPNK